MGFISYFCTHNVQCYIKMKRPFLLALALLLLATVAQGQQRDRRVDLHISCGTKASVSSTGRLWIASRCGEVYTADSIGATWRTISPRHDHTGEIIIPFGDRVALHAGYIPIHRPKTLQYDCLFRTETGGQQWDTVQFGKGNHWLKGHHYTSDGHLWIGSSQATQPGYLFFSADSGRTFTTLRSEFDTAVGIVDVYMMDKSNGVIAGFDNQIYVTTDNWRTYRRLPTPRDQGLHRRWRTEKVRPWHGMLLVRQRDSSFYSPADNIQWQYTPLADFEVDTVNGNLWAITDSGQLVLMQDMQHRQVVKDSIDLPFDNICGTLGGNIYLFTSAGMVRVSPDGQADTSGFYTEEKTLEEVFAELIDWHGAYASAYLTTLSHGGRLWRTDNTSIYLQDALGWYRIAKPHGIREMHADPDREDRVVILRSDGMNYSIDTAGHIEPYTYSQPLARFLESGLKSVGIQTYKGGCFHFDEQLITYTRKGDLLREKENTVEKKRHAKRTFPVEALESSLRRLGEVYSLFPTPSDFSLQEGEVDLHKVFSRNGGCTSYSGYRIIFTNRQGDTLRVDGNSNADCGKYFPWMLPMKVSGGSESFVTYQPTLWQALRPMMPEDMMHRRFLNNSSLFDLRPGDLLFFRDTTGMGSAVRESTGKYTHVALVESVDDTVWIIDATQRYGVSRRPLTTKYGSSDFPDVYRFKSGCFSIDSVLARARSFIGQPYDNAFQPDNGALYCSELVYEVFLDDCSDKGKHLIEAKPMNWRDKEGNLPQYWQEHFKKLGMPVPEGVPGTNPTDMSRSPMLQKL